MTIYDIAEQAGVSTATVSRVINGSSRVSEKTKEKILRIMEETHFVTNSSAKSLASKKSRTIGILVESIRNIHYMEAANVIVNFFDSIGYACTLVPSHHSKDKHIDALRSLAERNIDALVLVGSAFMHDEVRETIQNYFAETPVLMVNGEIDLPNVISILADEKQGTMDATELLLRKGKKHVVFVNGRNIPSNVKKKEGFVEACEQNGIIDHKLWKINVYGFFEMVDAIKAMLATYPETDGVVFSDDLIGCAGARAIMETGCRVPEDIAYVSINNDTYSYVTNPRMTTVDNRILELAEIGCNLLTDCIHNGHSPLKGPMIKKCRLIERETT